MPQDEIESLAQDEEGGNLRTLVVCEPEIEQLQKIIDEKSKSLKDIAQSNAELKTELSNRIEIYQDSLTQLESVEEENRQLLKEQAEKCVTKKQLVNLINQKVKAQDMKCKDLEKQFLKKVEPTEPMDPKSFAKSYLAQRVQYHKYQIHKVKVQTS